VLLCKTCGRKKAEQNSKFHFQGISTWGRLEGDPVGPEEIDREIAGNRHTIDAINRADTEAVSGKEKTVTAALNAVYMRHLKFIGKRESIRLDYWMRSEHHETAREIDAKFY